MGSKGKKGSLVDPHIFLLRAEKEKVFTLWVARPFLLWAVWGVESPTWRITFLVLNQKIPDWLRLYFC